MPPATIAIKPWLTTTALAAPVELVDAAEPVAEPVELLLAEELDEPEPDEDELR